ncbi:hypothetical protein CEUSTIGMA_g9705.t1 [Chlamydomonas eustigma]|uniref:RCC1-like domain-containing protein n=1 Tax=Chlamydomonas eustigma TaxID=1157962 RepID=A0A250XGX3_9CHLO|nr:hypothetical protein CEUSTIGMA_g9705.t1 [Chlamydomonas eustigma]|eukprot:GAX82276.1 hypothetical protein CEUSTIGMA_g9705.t1 [Chlamydomonas eustigma]
MENSESTTPSVISIGCGSAHSAALISCGVVASWGKGEDGQLGHGDANEISEPKAIFSLIDAGVRAVVCGAEFTVAVAPDKIYSWGWGDFGRLGHGNSLDQFLPKEIAFFVGKKVDQVACGDTHTLVLVQGGELYSFGRNQNGQLGVGHANDCLSPHCVEALREETVCGIACGSEHSVASTSAGQPVVLSTQLPLPALVSCLYQRWSGEETVCSIACGSEHSVASTSAGQVWAWGWGRYGNLGDGNREDRLVPVRTLGLDGVHISQVACGWRHSMAVDKEGRMYTFGWSKYGQLGHGDLEYQLKPKIVEPLSALRVETIAGGWRHSMAAASDGKLYGWGWNKFGQLGVGDGDDRCTPSIVPLPSSEPESALPALTNTGCITSISAVRLLACGWRHTMVAMNDGRVYSWGRGVNGQLGHGEEQDIFKPRLLRTLCQGVVSRSALLSTTSSTCGTGGENGVVPEVADRYAVVPDGGTEGEEAEGDYSHEVPYYDPDDAPATTDSNSKRPRVHM